MTRERATAFVPGHVTGFFSAHPATDPAVAGSRGAGVTLTDGVEVTVTIDESRDADTKQTTNGDPRRVAPVTDVLDTLGVDGAVAIETELPVGAGFGVSGAAPRTNSCGSPTRQKSSAAPVSATWSHRPVAAFPCVSIPVHPATV